MLLEYLFFIRRKKRSRASFFLFFFFLIYGYLFSQETFPVNGPEHPQDHYTVFLRACIHVSPRKTLENGMLIIQKDKIVYCGPEKSYPANAVVVYLNGKHIYPSFIDLDSDYGMPEVKASQGPRFSPQFLSNKPGSFYWNEAIKPENNAAELFRKDSKKAEELRKNGIGVVLSHIHDGIIRGTSALVLTGDEKEHQMVVMPRVGMHYSFKKGTSTQDYPSSQMGSIALIRQALYDAMWYERDRSKKEFNLSLEALVQYKHLPVIFEVDNKLESLRAAAVAKEFKQNIIIRGSGDEYQRIKEISRTGIPFILPVNFPEPYKIEDPYQLEDIDLSDLKHWETAPFNPLFFYREKIPFAFTSALLEKKEKFLENIRKVIESGLPDTVALAALTIVPARLIKADNILGTLEPGKLANFFITDIPVFDKESSIYEHWIRGKKYVIKEISSAEEWIGSYRVIYKDQVHLLTLKKEKDKLEGEWGWIEKKKDERGIIRTDTIKINFQPEINYYRISFHLRNDSLWKGTLHFAAQIRSGGNIWEGEARMPDGSWQKWSAVKQSTGTVVHKQKADTAIRKTEVRVPSVFYPNMNYGWDTLPVNQNVFIKNATVWTCESEQPLYHTDILVQKGKIIAIGQNLPVPSGILVIDASGKHVTPGLVDEHSHIAISKGVNEGTQASSAEVRIGDVINSDDINIYRQLAGGVTTVQLLHGSANPIGGQSAIIKLRWGFSPEEMKIEGAPAFIKFALGENVKQSNWGDFQRERYPQTRMGVEQIYYENFTRAREYQQIKKIIFSEASSVKRKKKEKQEDSTAFAFRKDLELEALQEILEGKRYITCHSYVQSEINMLIHVADSMGFKVNTFTHVLEGYKVADKLKKHGAGASTFSDWWAYKFEVNDAIPYNAALLTRMGVITAINSDDAEMGRRLNHEAAKTIKYGGLSEMEALKTITLNPARLLHLDHRIGSIKEGKDADLVIWSNSPLSVYAEVEKTIVDGRILYDKGLEQQLRERDNREKSRIVQQMKEQNNKQEGREYVPRKKILYHCNSLENEE